MRYGEHGWKEDRPEQGTFTTAMVLNIYLFCDICANKNTKILVLV
jgi:hypothetical protein